MLRHLRRPGDVLISFVRVDTERGPRVGRRDGETIEVLDHDDPLAALRGVGTAEPLVALGLLAPIHAPEVWCAGVTYERSRDARLEEAMTDARDVYALVYDAERPELFMKDANMARTVGPGGSIRLRRDSSWMVPEPELALVFADAGLLDGRPATTHWASLERLATLGDRIEVRPAARFVDDGEIITAAGVSAGIDVALHLVARLHSPERAAEVRREIQYYPEPPV